MTLTDRTRGWTAVLAALLACLWFAAAAPAIAQTGPRFPALTGRVVDQGDLISPQQEAALALKLEALERDTTHQLVVVTVPDLQGYEIEDYGYRLGRAWGIGQQGRNNGVLLLVAPNERRVRIEVGYGLEPVLTDALSALIIHDRVLPSFRDGHYERGIEQGVDAIDAQLRLEPAEAQARAAAAERPRAGFPVGAVVLILAVLFMLSMAFAGAAGRGRRRRGGVAPILIWAASEAMRNGGRSSWGGGGGFGGGGFGGGGGSFGGGGASGGW